MTSQKNIRFRIKSAVERYQDYVRLNRNMLLSILSAMFVSSLFSQAMKGQAEYVNATLTITISYTVYYVIFGTLYYRDNKEKYLTDAGTINNKKLRKDFIKIVSSIGGAEIVYFSSRWLSHYHFLSIGYEPFLASIISHVIAATLFVLAVNIGVYFTKLHKKDTKNT